MPADYKLRLGDGTILGVDEAGLRTWLLDDKAMVQPAGSRRWMPLKEVVAQVQANAAAEARRAAAAKPPPEPTPPAPLPRAPTPPPAPTPLVAKPVATPAASPPPAAASDALVLEETPFYMAPAAEAPVVAPPVVMRPPETPPPAPSPPRPVPIVTPKIAPPPPAAAAPVVAPPAARPSAPTPPVTPAPRPVPISAPKTVDRPPVVAPPAAAPPAPPKPPAQAPRAAAAVTPPARPPSAPTPAPLRPAAVAAPKPAASVPAGPPLDLAEVARTALVTPIAEMTSAQAPRETPVWTPVPGEDLSVIPFRPLDDDELRERAAAKTHDDDDQLEDLQLVEAQEDPLLKATRKADELLAKAVPWVRRTIASVRAASSKLAAMRPSSPASSPEPRKPVEPPPSLRDVPVLRFADEKEQAAGVRTRKLRTKGKLLIAGSILGILVVATGWAWIPALIALARRLSAPAEKKAAIASPPASPLPPPPTLPPDVQAAVDQLPHLTPETIQIVMKKSAYRPRDPAEVFSRAETAAVRGMSSLPEEEAQELSALRLAVARALRPTDRQRVRGYERIRTGRELLSASEDIRVLALFARGVRALPPEKRERLQVLLGKAIVAELGPLPSPEPGMAAAR